MYAKEPTGPFGADWSAQQSYYTTSAQPVNILVDLPKRKLGFFPLYFLLKKKKYFFYKSAQSS